MSNEAPTMNPVENDLAVPRPDGPGSSQDEGAPKKRRFVRIGGITPDPKPPSPPRMYEAVPRFSAPSPRNPSFSFSTLGGRPIALTFFGSAASPAAQELVRSLQEAAEATRDSGPIFCGVSNDPRDESERKLEERPTFVLFWDFEKTLAEAFGVLAYSQDNPHPTFKPQTFIIDPRLRLFRVIPITDPKTHLQQVLGAARACALAPFEGRQANWAPVMELPRVFEPELCRKLIEYYQGKGGEPSGFMRQVEGKTVGILDPKFKRRRDVSIGDEALLQAARIRVQRRLVPEIFRAFQFRVTRIERDIVACYDAEEGGYFNPHRDNTTSGTLHRRFACTINLNSEEFDGGELRFPEFGQASYKPPTGGACIFSCSLLHQALPVTRGTRYVYLPFLYDDEGAKIRSANQATIDNRQRGADGEVIQKEANEDKKTAAE